MKKIILVFVAVLLLTMTLVSGVFSGFYDIEIQKEIVAEPVENTDEIIEETVIAPVSDVEEVEDLEEVEEPEEIEEIEETLYETKELGLILLEATNLTAILDILGKSNFRIIAWSISVISTGFFVFILTKIFKTKGKKTKEIKKPFNKVVDGYSPTKSAVSRPPNQASSIQPKKEVKKPIDQQESTESKKPRIKFK